MKNLYLKILVFVIITIFAMVLTSCTKNSPKASSMESFSLVSPNGIILTNNLDDLKNIIVYNSDIGINKDEIRINDIRYNENDNVSFGIVDFISNDENKSMLVPLKIDDNLALLVDDKNIYIREISSTSKLSFESRDTIIFTNELISAQQTTEKTTVYVCSGDCCGWSQLSEDHYQCGCSVLTTDTGLVLSTSNGCVIQVMEVPPE